MEFGIDLNITWFILIGFLLTGYAILDGFDLGVGSLHLFAKNDHDRRVLINSIGPVWDGNEVWLVTGGGALFAAFPDVYATVFSGFYTAFFLLLFVLVFRAISIEFRSKLPSSKWRNAWDRIFSFSSLLIAFLMGVALGNIIWGVPIGHDKEFAGTFLGLLNPFALMVGIMTVALFMTHGAIYLTIKTEGDLQKSALIWFKNSFAFFVVIYIIATTSVFLFAPHLLENYWNNPLLFSIAMANVFGIVLTPFQIKKKKYFRAFLLSSLTITALFVLFSLGIFPNIVFSTLNPEYSLTIYNAASSQKTLGIMLIMAIIGMPLVLLYTFTIYRIFKGKVKIDELSY